MLRDLGVAVGRADRADVLAGELEAALLETRPLNGRVALPMIWHDPLMAANGATYAGNMVACMGYEVPLIDPDGTGYPTITPQDIITYGITDLFLSSEPHEFSLAEGEALVKAVVELGGHAPSVHLIDGEALTWMGSYTTKGLNTLFGMQTSA